ncbi:MAG: hypothetical protein UR82_C0092G0005 [Candidatus Moranbacteria bacterium GW2011_GWF1_35_5]|nr:MAG: hypothetical protein UR82_C0092G0005 [Candidatus Moranbacteria bacterium GW2011_GWF1_35_5]
MDTRDKIIVDKIEIKKIKIFGVIPFLLTENAVNYKKIYLFNIVPFLKIKKSKESTDICLISWKLVIFRIKTRNI